MKVLNKLYILKTMRLLLDPLAIIFTFMGVIISINLVYQKYLQVIPSIWITIAFIAVLGYGVFSSFLLVNELRNITLMLVQSQKQELSINKLKKTLLSVKLREYVTQAEEKHFPFSIILIEKKPSSISGAYPSFPEDPITRIIQSFLQEIPNKSYIYNVDEKQIACFIENADNKFAIQIARELNKQLRLLDKSEIPLGRIREYPKIGLASFPEQAKTGRALMKIANSGIELTVRK
jgi:hypothetical protein